MSPSVTHDPAAGSRLTAPAATPSVIGTRYRPAATNRGRQAAGHGTRWLLGSFVLCPCHLPITLMLLGTVLSGTVVGAVLHRYPLIAGAIITIAWAVGTVRGLRLLRTGASCPIR